MYDKVLITYGWNRVAYIVNRSLSEKGIKTFVGDIHKITMNSFSKFTFKFFQYPNFYLYPKKFIDFIISFCKKEEISIVIPIHEESFLFSKYKKVFERYNIKFLLPDFNVMKLAHKKNESTELATKLGIPTPETIFPKTLEDMIYFFKFFKGEIVVKFLNTNSSKGVFFPKSEKELLKFEKFLGNFILQERVAGTGYGVSMLFNNGNLRAKFTHRRLQEKFSTGGTSVLRESTENPLLEEYAYKLLKHLKWNGVAMVEFKYDEKQKKAWFIEINPRFWGSLALPYVAGVDFPYLVYKILKYGDVEPVFHYKKGVKVKWLLGGIISFISNLLKGNLNISYIYSKADAYDDFWKDDKYTFIGELLYYGLKFFRTLSINPTQEALLNIDEL